MAVQRCADVYLCTCCIHLARCTQPAPSSRNNLTPPHSHSLPNTLPHAPPNMRPPFQLSACPATTAHTSDAQARPRRGVAYEIPGGWVSRLEAEDAPPRVPRREEGCAAHPGGALGVLESTGVEATRGIW